jgi:CheY-like chemotaxis protein
LLQVKTVSFASSTSFTLASRNSKVIGCPVSLFEEGSQTEAFMLTNRSVLLVEDDGGLRVVLSAMLARTGYQVRTAWDGVSALLEIETGVPDIVVSDLNMPRMSGFELLSTVRAQFPSIPLIAMSGTFSGDRVPDGVVADAFYEKGAHPVCLMELVSAMMRPQAVQWDTA